MRMVFYNILITGIELLIPTVLLLPLLVLLCRRKGFGAGLTARLALFLLYLCAVYSITGLPTLRNIGWDPEVYLLPVAGMAEDVRNSVLNVALFVPMGVFLPLLCGEFASCRKTLLFGLCATLFIELAQLFNFRLTDINDVITNFAGCALGFMMARLFPKGKTAEKPGILFAVTVCVIAFEFLVQPYLLPAVWDWLF